MTIYTTVTQESTQDLKTLKDNKYNLQVAKSVAASDGKTPIFNVVYTSQNLAPSMTVKWTTLYGLNWTSQVPNLGAQVTYNGKWQSCDLGQSFDLDEYGLWQANQNNPNAKRDYLNVGSNGYATPVNIVVGVQDPRSGDWTPIWVAPEQLLAKGHGEYKPLESVRLWYQQGNKTATMIYNQETPYITYPFGSDTTWYFHYDVANGQWQNQGKSFDLTSLEKSTDLVPYDGESYVDGLKSISLGAVGRKITLVIGF